jgi:hypothetical protein
MAIQYMKILETLPRNFPGKGDRVSVKTGETAERADQSVAHILFYGFIEGQDLGMFSLP